MSILLLASVIGLAAAIGAMCRRAGPGASTHDDDPRWEEIELVELPEQEAMASGGWDDLPLVSDAAAWPDGQRDPAAGHQEMEALRATCARLESELAQQQEALETSQRGWQQERSTLELELGKLRSGLRAGQHRESFRFPGSGGRAVRSSAPVHEAGSPDDEQLFARLLQLIAPRRAVRPHRWLFGMLAGSALVLALVVACAFR